MIKCKDGDCLIERFSGCCAECPDRDVCGEILQDEEVKYSDWDWDCPCPEMGG